MRPRNTVFVRTRINSLDARKLLYTMIIQLLVADRGEIWMEPPSAEEEMFSAKQTTIAKLMSKFKKEIPSMQKFMENHDGEFKNSSIFRTQNGNAPDIPKNWNGISSKGDQSAKLRNFTSSMKTKYIGRISNRLPQKVTVQQVQTRALTFEDDLRRWNNGSQVSFPETILKELRRIKPIKHGNGQDVGLGSAIKKAFTYHGNTESQELLKRFNDSVNRVLLSPTVGLDNIMQNCRINYLAAARELLLDNIRNISDFHNALKSGLKLYYRAGLYRNARISLQSGRVRFYRHNGKSKFTDHLAIESKLNELRERYKEFYESRYKPVIRWLVEKSELNDREVLELLSRKWLPRTNNDEDRNHPNVFSRTPDALTELAAEFKIENEMELELFAALIYDLLIKDITSDIVNLRFTHIHDVDTVKRNINTIDKLVTMVNHLGKLPFRSALYFGCLLMAHVLEREIILDSEEFARDPSSNQATRLFSIYPLIELVADDRGRVHPRAVAVGTLPFIGIRAVSETKGGGDQLSPQQVFVGISVPEETRRFILRRLKQETHQKLDPAQNHFSRRDWGAAGVIYVTHPQGFLRTDIPSPFLGMGDPQTPIHIEYVERSVNKRAFEKCLQENVVFAQLRSAA